MAEELLLFAPLLRELRIEMALAAERERLSTFSGAILALKEQLPTMAVNFEEAKSCVQKYYLRRDADRIAALVSAPKF